MIDDIRPRSEGDKYKDNPNQKTTENSSGPYKEPYQRPVETPPASEVNSLPENSQGFIGVPSIPPNNEQNTASKRKFMSRGLKLWPSSKQHKMLGSVIGVFIIIFGSGGLYALNKYLSRPAADPVAAGFQKRPPKTTEPSKLTGVEVPIGTNKRPIVSIQMENSPDARPQAGLIDAGVVYEAIAEGGITRFNANYLEGRPGYIGPIRSVRPYYAALAAPFDPIFVHAGGSGAGLDKIRHLKLMDFDHSPNAGAFQRVRDRYAPHNLYSSMKAITDRSKQRGYKTSNTKSFVRKKKETPAKNIKAKSIDINISSPLYNVHYDYNKKSNSYNRVMGGKPHNDHKSGKRISPKVVIALSMKYSKQGIYSVYKYTGSGEMFVFQDGTVTKGTWKKKSDKEQFVFIGPDKKPLELTPGQTWITLVDRPGAVKYAP
ncbi:DUF3048 domain-containing protein [Candidatus Parcubacteria bacterium]|nr:DUF3048 domain-containing protein [Candidatus Parcubacteria bacterium]